MNALVNELAVVHLFICIEDIAVPWHHSPPAAGRAPRSGPAALPGRPPRGSPVGIDVVIWMR